MMNILRYTPDRQAEWDNFVRGSRNGTFLFERAYMDYHADRFADHSLLFYDDQQKLIAVLPANEADGALWSHQGLTYGGLVLRDNAHTYEVGRMFSALHYYMYTVGMRELHYKPVPTIYHRIPSEEDEYWLWRYDAVMEGCNIAATVNLKSDISVMSRRKRTYRNHVERDGFTLCIDTPLELYWPVLTDNLLSTYNAAPVHTLDEMQRLKAAFPDNIKCWTVMSPEGEVVGGTVLYISGGVVHTQYISASEQGKQAHALDYLFVSAIEHFREQGMHNYFDFGTSNGRGGLYLDDDLIMQKELFGGRGVTYKSFCLCMK